MLIYDVIVALMPVDEAVKIHFKRVYEISKISNIPLAFLRWSILDQLASYTNEGQLNMWRCR